MTRRTRSAVLVLAALAAASHAAAQAAPPGNMPSGGGRMLGGHTYVPLSPVPGPFVGTSFGTSLGGAIAGGIIEAVLVNVGGQQDTLLPAGDLVFGTFQVAYQQNVARRFAVRGTASLSVRTGTNARMLFAEGLSGVGAFSLGGLAVLHRDEHRMLTATLDVRRSNLTELTPQDFAEYVGEWGIDSLEHWGEHLLHDRRNGRIVGGMRGAWTLRPWLGLSAMLEAGPTNLYESGGRLATTIGAGGSIDFRNLKRHVPIGLSLGVGRTNTPSSADDIFGATTVLGWGLYYTGRDEFAVGLDSQTSTTKLLETGKTVRVTGGRFTLRYDF